MEGGKLWSALPQYPVLCPTADMGSVEAEGKQRAGTQALPTP